MKKVIIYSACLVLLIQTSCTKKFDEINADPTRTTATLFNANYLLAQGQWEFSNTGYNQLLFQSMWSQVLASTYGYYGNGDKYVFAGSFAAYRNNLWNSDYRAASLIYEMQNLVKDNPEWSNLYNVGTLMKVIIMQRITDVYGDIPYSEALRAKEGITQPVYDRQQDIYNSMLSEVETAINALDASKKVPTNDVMYSGDITKWKKFGYSLMVRLAMRLTKIDPATARTWVEKAAAGGTFAGVEDNARVRGDQATGFSNATSNAMRVADDYREVRWSEPFIEYLKSNNDPRLSAIAEVSQPGLANNQNQELSGNTNPAVQIGLPNGFDLNGGATDIRNYPLYPGPSGSGDDVAYIGNYSRPRTEVYLDRSGINMVLTYPEVEYLLAEAAARGWSVGASAAQHYANGLAGAMESLAQFDEAAAIAESTINAFVTNNPLDESSPEASIRQINEQYWIATGSLFMFIENWINWRRSGYPVLEPVDYPGQFTNGTIPRRVPYETNEPSNNPANYNEAISRQGEDEFTTRVWWDAP